jgi:acetyltransferase-like isoleucine patch superfamily enzyme
MSYGTAPEGKKHGLFKKLCIKIGKMIAGSFPCNSLRVCGLRLCGYSVGHNVYIGPGLIIASLISESGCDLIIGDRVAIGPRVTLILSSDANWSKLNGVIEPVRGTIHLCNDCWLGAGVIVLPQITIGECSVAGAGSVVTTDIPDYTVFAGVPAKKIRSIEKKAL